MENHAQTTDTDTTTSADDGLRCLLHGKGCKNEGTPPLMYVIIDGEKSPIHGVPRDKGLKSCVQVLEESILAKNAEDGLPKLRNADGSPLYRLGHGGNVRFEQSSELEAIQKKNREKAHERELKRESKGLELGALQFLQSRGGGNTVLKDKMEEVGLKSSEAPLSESKPVKKDWRGRLIAD